MPARSTQSRVRLALAGGVLLAAMCAVTAQPQPDPAKKPPDPPKTNLKMPPLVRLFDGSFQWFAPPPANGTDPERVQISPLELQKLHDQIEQLKKQAANRKPVAPSGCAVRVGIETRGETTVAVVRATYTFRTTVPNTVVSLGGKRSFLVSGTLDARRGLFGPAIDTALGRPTVLMPETTEEGFAAVIETAGAHTLILDLETQVGGRGSKTEIGFELGLPRAAITTFTFDPPNNIRRVNLTIRTPDMAQPAKPAEVRRFPGLDVKQLTPRPEAQAGIPLGPVDSLEVTWDPPAAAAQPTDTVLSVDWDVLYKLSDRAVEVEAKARPRGNARTWRFALPKKAELTASRVAREAGTDVGPVMLPMVTRPTDPNIPVWTVEIPTGSTAADWVLTATDRQERVKPTDPSKPTPIPIGPFAALNVARQTGTVRIAAAGSVRFEFDHGAELHRMPVVEPIDAGTSDLLFRLATGPTGNALPGPWMQLKTFPVAGAVRVKPTYRLHLTPTSWQIEADVLVTPVRAEIDSLTVDFPAAWHSLVAEPLELVAGLQQVEKGDGPRRTATITLAGAQRRPFELKLRANIPLTASESDLAVALPRFPTGANHDGKLEVSERDASVTATVGAGLEVRGSGREWEGDQTAAWGTPLAATPNAEGKSGRSVGGRFEHGVARIDLNWQPHRSEVMAEMRAEVTVERRQLRVLQTIRFQGPGNLPRSICFRGPPVVAGLKADPPLRQYTPGEWFVEDGAELKDGAMRIEYALPIPKMNADDRGAWAVLVPLFWPADVTRTETTTRIWTAADGVLLDDVQSVGWRDLPPEPARQALPAATLSASGSDGSLTLHLREAEGSRGTAVWVSRGLIRVRPHEFGPTDYEARFLLHRWLTDSIEVRIPGSLAGEHPEVLIDGVPADPNFVSDPNDPAWLMIRVPLPESRSHPVELDVKYQIATEHGNEDVLRPPQLRGAAFDGPVRWHVVLPGGVVPLLTEGGTAEQRWSMRFGLVLPAAGRTSDALDDWFHSGTEVAEQPVGATTDLVVRQATPSAIRVASVSRVRLLILCSLGAFAVGFGLTRLRSAWAGPLVALLGGMVAAAAVRYPQPVAQVATAAEPGAAALVLVVGILAFARWRARRRVTHLPGFVRVRVEHPAGPVPTNSTGSVRKPLLGSTGSNGAASEPHPHVATGSKADH